MQQQLAREHDLGDRPCFLVTNTRYGFFIERLALRRGTHSESKEASRGEIGRKLILRVQAVAVYAIEMRFCLRQFAIANLAEDEIILKKKGPGISSQALTREIHPLGEGPSHRGLIGTKNGWPT